MESLTIHLDDNLTSEIERLAKVRKQSKSEVARQLLRGSVVRDMLRRLQSELGPQAREAGWLVEGDVLRDE